MLARQAPLDDGLSLMQPIERAVQIIDAAFTHTKHSPQRRAGALIMQLAMGGKLGGRLDYARH